MCRPETACDLSTLPRGRSRLPLVSVAVPAFFAYLIPNWWLVGLPLLLLVAATLVSDILWESETRDF
ncbi:hypothetical protein [Singulisphaera sp. GP187]|uniref:hypothetical protein n=1 Tax=Singulisphaera sp. GP187 TaxID=1882752 RepID=UPI001161078B|nr:hypothetical protein [Singulisphaera sp. GP187]